MLTKFLAPILMLMHAVAVQAAQPQMDCLPQERGSLELRAIQPNFFTVSGRFGGFDPCESSVKFRTPKDSKNSPVIISVHGGGGIGDVLRSDEEFHKRGFATLAFDAYSMQGIGGRDAGFWARSVTNEARQRMIFTTALAAYKWVVQRSDVDTRRVYLFGISNGAAVVANLAALVDPAHVKGVIAEGITPIGLGLPDRINVPVLVVFGNLDNFGNPDSSGKRWTLTDDCRLNIQFKDVPTGTSRYCNQNSSPGARIPTSMSWIEAIKKGGGTLEDAFIDDMAHSAFWGPLTMRKQTWTNGQTLDASLGATDAAKEKLMRLMLDFIDRYR
jgi:dienelactone hydrolase